MKKLIALLSVISLTASTSLVAVACSNKPVTNNFTYAYNETEIKILAEQYAKAYYLNQTKKYDFDYLINQFVKNNFIGELTTVELTKQSGLQTWTRFSKISTKYLNQNDDNYQNIANMEQGKIPEKPNIIMQISGILPTISKLIQQKNIFGLMLYLVDLGIGINPDMISQIELLDYGEVILSDQNIDLLAQAFNDDKYQGFTLEQTLNSSILGFSNALNKISQTKNPSIPVDQQASENWMQVSLEQMETAIIKLQNQETLNLNLISNFDAVCEIINFARVFGVYLSTFATQQNSRIATNQNTSVYLTWKELEAFKNQPYDEVANQVDFKQLVKYLTAITNVSDEDEGNELLNLLNLLFREKQKYAVPKVEINPVGINVDEFIKNFNNKDYSGSTLPSFFKAFLNSLSGQAPLGSIIVGGIGIIGAKTKIVSSWQEPLVKPILKLALGSMIKDQDLIERLNQVLNIDKILSQPWNALWTKNLLGILLGVEKKDLSIKSMLKTPIFDLLGIDEIFGFALNNHSLASAMLKLDTSFSANNADVKIDFNNVNKLILQLKGTIKIMQTNPSTLMTHLGLDKQNWANPIREESFFYYLQKIVVDLNGSENLINYFALAGERVKQEQAKIHATMQKDFKQLKASEISLTNQLETKVIINDREILVELAYKTDENKYFIKKIS